MSESRIAELRSRQLAEGATQAEKPIYTPHGTVWLRGENWAAIADVLEKIFDESSGD